MNRAKSNKFWQSFNSFPDDIRDAYNALGNSQVEKRHFIEGLYRRSDNGRDWQLDTDGAVYKHAITKTEEQKTIDGIEMIPRCIMLQKFQVTGEVSHCNQLLSLRNVTHCLILFVLV